MQKPPVQNLRLVCCGFWYAVLCPDQTIKIIGCMSDCLLRFVKLKPVSASTCRVAATYTASFYTMEVPLASRQLQSSARTAHRSRTSSKFQCTVISFQRSHRLSAVPEGQRHATCATTFPAFTKRPDPLHMFWDGNCNSSWSG